MDVLAGAGAGEEPRAVAAASGAEVRPVGEIVADEAGEWLRNSCGMASELDVEFVAVLGECVGLERGHADEWLGVEQQQDAGDAVGERLAGSGEEFVEPGQALVLGQRRARLGGAVLDLHGGVEAGALGGAGQRARCRVERGRGSRSASVIHQMQYIVDIMSLIGARTTGVAVDATTPVSPRIWRLEALGYATRTIEQHARASATTSTRYVASRHTTTSA